MLMDLDIFAQFDNTALPLVDPVYHYCCPTDIYIKDLIFDWQATKLRKLYFTPSLQIFVYEARGLSLETTILHVLN